MGRREGRLAGHQVTALELAEVIAGHDGYWTMYPVESGRLHWKVTCSGCESVIGEGRTPSPGLIAFADIHRAHVAAVVLAHLEADGWAKAASEAPEIRYAELVDGTTELDEVVARNAYVHLEAMSDNAWWLGIEAGGQMVHVNLWTKRAKITGRAEVDDL